MLREPTMEKLYALRLAVMAMAWQEQEKDPKLRELEFGDRFGCSWAQIHAWCDLSG